MLTAFNGSQILVLFIRYKNIKESYHVLFKNDSQDSNCICMCAMYLRSHLASAVAKRGSAGLRIERLSGSILTGLG